MYGKALYLFIHLWFRRGNSIASLVEDAEQRNVLKADTEQSNRICISKIRFDTTAYNMKLRKLGKRLFLPRKRYSIELLHIIMAWEHIEPPMILKIGSNP
jgi:hypothetical protein